jgi:sigma-B regulation protein RsbU (phosphoserine phosphatase)
LPSTGTVLGAFEDIVYKCSVHHLKKGDKILLFSDGVLEVSRGDKIFGYENVEAILNYNKNNSIADVTKDIVKAASEFSDSGFFDDVTILGIEII